ncbi:MAG: hypothetical protein R2850_04545 [Bacteroidia bacterium]
MKKVLFAAAVLALFASCKKDYTCTCTAYDQTIVTDYNNLSKGEASDGEDKCNESGLCVWAEK